jgi:hypothetical protein
LECISRSDFGLASFYKVKITTLLKKIIENAIALVSVAQKITIPKTTY